MNKITILTVCFNAESTIESTLISVISQTYQDLEYVIVDGGSSDGTLEKIKKYRNDKFVILSEPDKGIYDAINKGLKLASGDFLLVLGADDSLRNENVIQDVASCMEDADTVYYGNVYRSIKKDVYCGKYNSYKLAVKNISHQALFYPKSVFKNKEYKIEYRLFADYAYNIELWGSNKFKYIPIVVSNFSDDGSSATLKDEDFEMNRKTLICNNLGWSQYYYAEFYHWLRNIIKKIR